MTVLSCVLCHKDDLRVRWIGSMHATWCDFCGCIYIPEPETVTPAPAVGAPASLDSPSEGFLWRADRSGGPAVPA